MSVERIFIRPPGGNLTVEHKSVRVVAGAGIEGDRYFDAHEEPGQNITFVEAEAIEAFAQEHRREIDPFATGRNVVTRGVRLNELVGREFVVGAVRFRGVELCEPCLTLGEALASPTLLPARVVKHWVHRGGLRADALTSGELSVGAGFESAAPRCSLTITDAAYSRIQRELAGSSIESPIISLVQSAGATLPPYAMLRAIDPDASGGNLHDLALDRSGPDSPPLQWNLIPGVYSREDVPIESRAEIRGIWFSFSPEWQQRMNGWRLDAVGDTLVLMDAAGKVILPSNPEAAGGA